MKGKKLTMAEAITKLENGEQILSHGNWCIRRRNGKIETDIYGDAKSTVWGNSTIKVEGMLATEWFEWIEPPKPKNLLERFANWQDIKLTYDSGHIYTDINRDINTDDFINWLDKQPESRLIIKKE